jgi:hypothetical protein
MCLGGALRKRGFPARLVYADRAIPGGYHAREDGDTIFAFWLTPPPGDPDFR